MTRHPSPAPPIHQSDPDAAPDSDFEPGELRHLVPGNTGRMLDPRRTPVAVRSIDPGTGVFELEVLAFEDAGARWTIEAERVSHFQFAIGAARAEPAEVAALERAIDRYDRPLHIPVDDEARARTERRLREAERRAGAYIDAAPRFDLASRTGDEASKRALQRSMTDLGLADVESALTERYASNPDSGDLVKGHRIVVAHLGLVAYDGKVPRDPDIFEDRWNEARRAEHILARLGFVRALFHRAGHQRVWLYRGLAAEGPLGPTPGRTFVSSTFDRAVAESLASRGPATVVSVLIGQSVPVERLFMTYIETAALDRVYHEAEAVLLADPANHAF